ncbi:MAG: glycosyltransferase family 2 protein [Bacteroidota bacterium]
MLKVSIITITYNSEATLADTLKSVLNQTYKNIEYIIIDGKSTDSTLSIIDAYKSSIAKVVSEKDNGLYDALNKGIAVATGDVIGILHSDDFYTSNTVIEKIVQTLSENESDAVYADLYYVDKNNTDNIFRKWKSGSYKHGMFLSGWMPPHPTFFAKRTCYQSFGSFNLNLVSAADYELMLRFIHKHKIKLAYLPEFIIKMRVGGKSNVSLKNRIRANNEDRKAWKINGLKPHFYTLYAKPLRKIIQLFKK